jgi:hypothetical protein
MHPNPADSVAPSTTTSLPPPAPPSRPRSRRCHVVRLAVPLLVARGRQLKTLARDSCSPATAAQPMADWGSVWVGIGWEVVVGWGSLGLLYLDVGGRTRESNEWMGKGGHGTGERERLCIASVRITWRGILDVICRCSASADSGSRERGAPKFTQPNRPASRIWLPEASVFGAASSWSDGKLEAGGIPNTPLVSSSCLLMAATIFQNVTHWDSKRKVMQQEKFPHKGNSG